MVSPFSEETILKKGSPGRDRRRKKRSSPERPPLTLAPPRRDRGAPEGDYEAVWIKQLNTICPRKGLTLVSAEPVHGRLSGRFFEADKWDVELAYQDRRLRTRVSRLSDFVEDPAAPPTAGEVLVSLAVEVFMNETLPEFEEWAEGTTADDLDREEFWQGATARARLRRILGDELDAFFKRTWQ